MEWETIFDVTYTAWGSGPMAEADKQRLSTYGGRNAVNQMFNKWWHVKVKKSDNIIVESYVWCDIHMLQHGHAIVGKTAIQTRLEGGIIYLNFYFDGRKYWFTNS